MKCWHKESEDCSNIKNKQTQIHMAALIASIGVLVLGLIAAPPMIYAQNTTSTPSNPIAESHTLNTTGTPLNATTSNAPKPMGG
jgi:hypothetical protein